MDKTPHIREVTRKNYSPGATLRIWAMTEDADQGVFNCGFGANIWNNDDPDPAVLYDATGREVDRK